MERRAEELGFTPQKETPYNVLLPYSDRLDAESNEQLSQIKANLARTVQLRDLKIGASHWTGQLAKYIRLYGHKFSKEDHVTFIKILFELITIPDLDYSLIQKFSQLLVTLLKKRVLLSREDLELPWRPLYKLLENCAYSPYEHHGLVLLPRNIENVLKNLIRVCRIYFPEDATQEIMDEFRPLMCPYDITMIKAAFFFELLLPTNLPPGSHHKGFKLWLDEFIGIWESCQNNPSWEASLVQLFARLANGNIGYIDWEPYLPQIFTRILRSFNVPVGSNRVQVTRGNTSTYEVGQICWWIVAMMGGGSSVQKYLNRMFKALESFYHPSNIGKWHTKLNRLMCRLPHAVVRRVHKERYKKTWETPVPESHKLTDDEITEFVESMKPVVFLAMFSKIGSHDSAAAFQHLSVLRPELIVPSLLEKTYPALETLTEPHRLIACLHCTVAVGRTMLGSPERYPEGRMHVLPLLNFSLPGIDPNDIKKCLITFQLISTLVSLVPLVDCSGAVHCRSDLSEEDRELCSATAQFEDFVMQFIDRVIALIENSAQEHTRTDSSHPDKLTHEEMMLEVGLLSTFSVIVQQCSTPIFEESLRRLFRFVSTSFMEIRVAGKFTADLVRSLVKARPEIALKTFIPHFCDTLKARTSGEDLSKEEHLDNEILWNLKLLSESVRCDGTCLLPYGDQLVDALQATLHLKCKEAADLAGNLLHHLLRAMTLIYALDHRSTTIDWNKPLSEVLPIREWGVPGYLYNLQLKWHIPCQEEKEFAGQVLKTFLVPELARIQDHVSQKEVMSREELLQCLGIIQHCLVGAGSCLPMWKGDGIKLIDSLVQLTRYSTVAADTEEGITLDGENVRVMIANTIRPLLEHLLKTSEDDTKSLQGLTKVYSSLLFYHGTQKDEFDGRWKSLHIVKKSLENKLLGKKHHIRALLVDRAQLQHELRVVNKCAKVFTSLHQSLFEDLFHLSVSRYSEVRRTAQSTLGHGFHLYSYSYRALLDRILDLLKDDSSIEHHQFKGALYLILGDGYRSLVTKRSWEVLIKVWPRLATAQHSEKPSILRLVENIVDKMHEHIETAEVKIVAPDKLIETAQLVWTKPSVPLPALPEISQSEQERGVVEEAARNKLWLQTFLDLLDQIAEIAEGGKLIWKFHQIALSMVSLVIRQDVPVPGRIVDLFISNLNHDFVNVRKICLATLSAVLKTQKRLHPKVEISPYKLSGTEPPSNTNFCQPGFRPDNSWVLYKAAEVPDTKEKWEACTFLEKTHWGYYCWPKHMYVYAPKEDQPKLDRSLEELPEGEVPIYKFFTNQESVDKLIKYLSLEENKGKDKFRSKNFTFFKGLFRNFGDTFVPFLRPHVERLVADTSHDTHECSQRCAAEIISGLIRASKHWPWEKVQAMWAWLVPVLKTGITNMTVDSVSDWGTCYATASESRDPRKLAPMLNVLLENQLTGDGGSFGDSSRLYLLQGAIAQQEWRIPEIMFQILDLLSPHLTHPYKNVRDRLSSVLVSIFQYDNKLPNSLPVASPRRKDFTDKVLPQLEVLRDIALSNGVGGAVNTGGTDQDKPAQKETVLSEPEAMQIPRNDGKLKDVAISVDDVEMKVLEKSEQENSSTENGESEERKVAVKLCKTVLKWLQGAISRMFQTVTADTYKFLPILCVLKSESTDDELKREILVAVACMAQALLDRDLIRVALDTIREISKLTSWHARAAILGYIQVMVFCNFFLMLEAETVRQVQDLVVELICDDQLEVREVAAITLGGFLQCGYLTMNDDMMKYFEKLSSTKIRKKKKQQQADTVMNPELLIKRHAGVLGLSACVQAFPYDVPGFIPQILMDLSDHLDDPQPIQMTVRKTLSNFKRTHLDNWQDHKLKFTDDQLVVLTDMLVSPNYYA